MVVEGAVVMVENIIRYLAQHDTSTSGLQPGSGHPSGSTLERIRNAAHEVQRPVFYSIGIIITAYVPIFTLQRVEGRLFKPHGLDGGVRAAGIADLFDADRSGDIQLQFRQPREGVAQSAHDGDDERISGQPEKSDPIPLDYNRGSGHGAGSIGLVACGAE